MDRIRIRGGNRLNGTIPISGAKNAALPLMIVSLLTPGTLTLSNVPRLADVRLLQRILQNHGIDIMVAGKRAGQNGMAGDVMHLTARDIADTTAPYELVSRMRASFWVIGPLLARCGVAKVSLPGGCAIGTRPVDLFLDGLQALGVGGDIACQEAQELAEQGVVVLRGLCAGQDHVSAGPNAVVELVAFAEPEGATHGFRDSGLVAVGQRGFDFEGGRHGALRSDRLRSWRVMQSPCFDNANALPMGRCTPTCVFWGE